MAEMIGLMQKGAVLVGVGCREEQYRLKSIWQKKMLADDRI